MNLCNIFFNCNRLRKYYLAFACKLLNVNNFILSFVLKFNN